jgi:hypothetical protein
VLVIALYSYLLIGFQPDRSFSAVIRENERNRIEYQRRWKEKMEADRKRRKQEVEEARRAQQEAEQSSNLSSTVTFQNADFIESTELKSNATTSRSSTFEKQKGRDTPPSLLHFLYTFIVSLACFALIRGLARMAVDAALRINPARQQQYLQTRAMNFQAWVARLNQHRQARGERPISAESLRLVLQERDLDGNDYDNLWAFHEEAGPAIVRGATFQEIRQLPHRTLGLGDDLLQNASSSSTTATLAANPPSPCPICLEPYRLHDTVRTIPCFHTFHTKCIDPWLVRKATCPVCKHPALP